MVEVEFTPNRRFLSSLMRRFFKIGVNMQIHFESLPERCDICHQSDCFDPATSHCVRCSGVVVSVLIPTEPVKSPKATHRQRRIIETALVVFILLTIGLIAIPNLMATKRRSHSERSALNMIRQIHRAQEYYQKAKGQGNYTPDLEELGKLELDGKPLLSLEIVKAQKQNVHGYWLGPIIVHPRISGRPARYHLTTFPCYESELSRCGSDCFYIDQTGIVRHSGKPNVIPTVLSEPLLDE